MGMMSGVGIVFILLIAYMMAFTTVQRDGLVEIAALFLLGSWLVGL